MQSVHSRHASMAEDFTRRLPSFIFTVDGNQGYIPVASAENE